MKRLPVLHYPDPRLRHKSRPVTEFDAGLHELLDALWNTMRLEGGIGLAAPQVAVPWRALVLDAKAVGAGEAGPLEVINPVILSASGKIAWDEACLSVPGLRESVRRHRDVVVSFRDRNGRAHKRHATGLLSVALQHEIDHLDGKLLLDRIPLPRRLVLLARLWVPSAIPLGRAPRSPRRATPA